jgi:carboxylesterase type B
MSYGGRTDGLFHRSIQESGSAATAWYNGTDWYQTIYQNIVDHVNCTNAIDTLECLRTVPYETIYPFMDPTTIAGPGWYPTVDGDIMPEFPTSLLDQGKFAHVPHLYGSNSDEGTDNAPFGIDTDQQLYDLLYTGFGFGYPSSTVKRIMELYPDDPALGVPINTGDRRFSSKGRQYKRTAAIVGDIFYHATRLDDARHYVLYSPTYIYRFNQRPWQSDTPTHLPPAYKGVEHFSEVSFVFHNPEYVGPWPQYKALSRQLSDQWINFVNYGDPNGDGLPHWPMYNQSKKGLNLVLQTEKSGGSFVEEDTYRLAGREYLSKWARRRHV